MYPFSNSTHTSTLECHIMVNQLLDMISFRMNYPAKKGILKPEGGGFNP